MSEKKEKSGITVDYNYINILEEQNYKDLGAL